MNSRRDFLQKITASAVALSFLPKSSNALADDPGAEPYQGPMLRVAIMGLGSYGTRVADAMKESKKGKIGRSNQWNSVETERLAK